MCGRTHMGLSCSQWTSSCRYPITSEESSVTCAESERAGCQVTVVQRAQDSRAGTLAQWSHAARVHVNMRTHPWIRDGSDAESHRGRLFVVAFVQAKACQVQGWITRVHDAPGRASRMAMQARAMTMTRQSPRSPAAEHVCAHSRGRNDALCSASDEASRLWLRSVNVERLQRGQQAVCFGVRIGSV